MRWMRWMRSRLDVTAEPVIPFRPIRSGHNAALRSALLSTALLARVACNVVGGGARGDATQRLG